MRAILPAGLLCAALAGQALASGYSTFDAGVAAVNRDDGDEAIRLLTLAIAAPDLAPRFLPIAYFDRGEMYFAKKQCEPAIADMTAGLRLDPTDFQAYLFRGFCYAGEKKPDLAVTDFTSAIGARPDLAKGYLVRGVFFAETEKNFASAIADFTTAIGIEPDNSRTYELRGDAYRRRADYDLALTDESKAIELAPKFSAAIFDRGLIYEDDGRFADALDDFKTVVELSPDNGDAALNVGLAQWEAGRFGDASTTFEATVKARPENAYWTLWLALARDKAAKSDDDMALRVAKIDLTKWPGPVVNVFLGKIPPDQAVQAASVGNPDALSGQKCEANFYVGEWQLLHQNPAVAKTMLQGAAAGCPHEFVEWPAANAELKRLP